MNSGSVKQTRTYGKPFVGPGASEPSAAPRAALNYDETHVNTEIQVDNDLPG